MSRQRGFVLVVLMALLTAVAASAFVLAQSLDQAYARAPGDHGRWQQEWLARTAAVHGIRDRTVDGLDVKTSTRGGTRSATVGSGYSVEVTIGGRRVPFKQWRERHSGR